MNKLISFFIVFFLAGCISSNKINEEIVILKTSPENANHSLTIEFFKGKAYNHPSFAVWTEDLEGNFIETLYVTQFVATGKFGHGEVEAGKWSDKPGTIRRPATLPYWAHKRGIKASDGLYVPSPETAVSDALSGATPINNFKLNTATKMRGEKFRLLMEINQPWDSNKFWTNNKFPGNLDYFTSLQPALVYAVTIDPDWDETDYYLNPIGHSEPSGRNGNLYTNLTTVTSAKEIVRKIIVHLE
ncbi:hypothetical protein [Maribellus maritimus]|uniref:hypothetical protein n=1 Tax=Maribellus maritimus TaxID=2870838 RepID=UPI001EEAF347|nr:hypothetical protein [Maribellus maritimus]MCG6188285.1 hypothetical protein [Maribellus maritimus]